LRMPVVTPPWTISLPKTDRSAAALS
jgi:hypothetical protein